MTNSHEADTRSEQAQHSHKPSHLARLSLTTTTHCPNDSLSREERVGHPRMGKTQQEWDPFQRGEELYCLRVNAGGGGYSRLTDFKSTGKAKNSWRMGHITRKDGAE